MGKEHPYLIEGISETRVYKVQRVQDEEENCREQNGNYQLLEENHIEHVLAVYYKHDIRGDRKGHEIEYC